jgi:hypothetical protein
LTRDGLTVVMLDRSPTDAELQTLVAPEGAPPYLTLKDDGTTLAAQPSPRPAALYWASMSLPAVGWIIALVGKWDELLGSPDVYSRLFSAIMTAGMVVVPVIGWFGFQWLNRHSIREDEFFVLDRVAGTLRLPRAGVILRRGDVAEVIEVHGWHRVRDAEGSSDYLREVSVLAHRPAKQLARYAVVVAGHAKPVGRVAAALAGTFAVPHRKLVESPFGGSWRRVPEHRG